MGIAFNNYKHYTINNFEKLLKNKDGLENSSIITTLILIQIEMHIRSTGFSVGNAPNLVFNPDKTIQNKSIQLLLKEFLQY